MKYIYLFLAVTFEVVGTLLLPTSLNFTKLIPSISVVIFYFLSFYFLTFALEELPIFIVYASWSGLGIFFITLFGYLFYEEKLNWQIILGLILIGLGVITVNFFRFKN